MFFHELWLVWTSSAHFTGCVWYAQNTHPTPGTVRTWQRGKHLQGIGSGAAKGWQSATGLSVSCLHMFFFLSIHGMFFLNLSCTFLLYQTLPSHLFEPHFLSLNRSLAQRLAQLFMPVTQLLRDQLLAHAGLRVPLNRLAGWRAFNFLPMRRGTGRSCFLEPQH